MRECRGKKNDCFFLLSALASNRQLWLFKFIPSSYLQVEKPIPQKEVSVSGNTCFRKKITWYEEALFWGKYILFFISNLNIYVVL